jgi:hypothetical protein
MVLQVSVLFQEFLERAELFRVDEVHQRPQFLHVVLQRSARQEEDVVERVLLQLREEAAVLVLEAVGLPLSVGLMGRRHTHLHEKEETETEK